MKVVPVIIVIFAFAYFEVSSAQPMVGEVTQCYERECPSRTSACKKVVQTSQDKKTLITTISCLDVQDMVLKDYTASEDNPYGPHTNYQSTSYAGTYIISSGGDEDVNVNINNEIDSGLNTGVIEDFS